VSGLGRSPRAPTAPRGSSARHRGRVDVAPRLARLHAPRARASHEARVDVSGVDACHGPRASIRGLGPGIPGTKKGPNQPDSCGLVWTLRGTDFQRETEGNAVFQSGPVYPLHGFDSRRLHPEKPSNRKGLLSLSLPSDSSCAPYGPLWRLGVSSPERRAAGGWADPVPAPRSPAPRVTGASDPAGRTTAAAPRGEERGRGERPGVSVGREATPRGVRA
jgi:hypothetical protein